MLIGTDFPDAFVDIYIIPSAHMSTWTILAVPERTKQDARKLQVKSTPYFQLDNFKSKNGTPTTRTSRFSWPYKWIKVLDKISFKKSEIGATLTNLSKRGCLASVPQMWDPMGLVVPCTIELRIYLQELWSGVQDIRGTKFFPKRFV